MDKPKKARKKARRNREPGVHVSFFDDENLYSDSPASDGSPATKPPAVAISTTLEHGGDDKLNIRIEFTKSNKKHKRRSSINIAPDEVEKKPLNFR